MKHLIRLLSLIFLLVFLLNSCEKESFTPTEDLTFGIRHDKVLEDYEKIATNIAPYNNSNYPDFSSVINFTYSLDGSNNYEYVASGVLVNSEWILTAGHNFYVSLDQSSPAQISGISVNIGNNPNNPDAISSVAELVFHPTWLDADDVFGNANDFCLVRLTNPITNITPAPLNSTSNEPINSTVWFCGFGDYSQLEGQDQSSYSKKHAIENLLDRKIDGITSQNQNGDSYSGGLVAFDFDSPNGEINALGDSFTSSDEPLLGSGTSESGAVEFEGATVQGDSGGPVFAKINNQWMVIGILSGGAADPIENYQEGNYGDISIFTRVSSNIDWINSVLQ